MTYYQLWQEQKFGNALPETEPEENETEDTRMPEHYELEIFKNDTI